jgi:hypothetical protein
LAPEKEFVSLIDRDFMTIDFLTPLDLESMPQVVRSRFLE